MSSRLVILSQVYHHGPTNDKPVLGETRCSYITVDETAYIRPMKANAEWHKLDFGWLSKVSTVMVKAKGRVELSFRGDGVPDVVVMPNDDARFMPLGEVSARGSEYTVYAFPELEIRAAK